MAATILGVPGGSAEEQAATNPPNTGREAARKGKPHPAPDRPKG